MLNTCESGRLSTLGPSCITLHPQAEAKCVPHQQHKRNSIGNPSSFTKEDWQGDSGDSVPLMMAAWLQFAHGTSQVPGRKGAYYIVYCHTVQVYQTQWQAQNPLASAHCRHWQRQPATSSILLDPPDEQFIHQAFVNPCQAIQKDAL